MQPLDELSQQIVQQAPQQPLNTHFQKIKSYALSLDPETAAVNICLERACRAVEDRDEPTYQRLAKEILITLDEKLSKINVARNAALAACGEPGT